MSLPAGALTASARLRVGRERVAAALVPAGAAGSGSRWRYPALVAGLAAGMIVLLWPRTGYSPADFLWAEDGRNFLAGALRHPLWHELFVPYGGYLQAVPRLIGAGAAALPLRYAAAFFAVTSALVRVCLAWLVYRGAAGHLPSPAIRLLLAAVVVLLPTGNFETLDDAANLHWFLFYGLFWLLLWRGPSRRWAAWALGLVALLAAASEPVALLLAPLAGLRAWSLPARHRAISYGYAVGLAAQAVAVLTGPRRGTMSPAPIATAAGAWLVRGPLTALVGTAEAVRLFRLAGYLPAVAAGVVIVGFLAAATLRGGPTRWLAVSALLLSVLVFGLIVFYDWVPALAPSTPGVVFPGDRYNVVPDLLLLTVTAAGLQGLAGRRRGSRRKRAPAFDLSFVLALLAVVAALLTGTVTTFGQPSGRTQGPSWRAALASARDSCAGKATVAKVAIEPPGWYAAISCRKL
ncbi:MAG: hypothetical protein ACYCO3_15265 [Mycobacteriales bacterium]